MFDHLLLTRFNVRLSGMAEAAPDERWLRRRLELFAEYCVPGVAAQTTKNFVWVLLIDESTSVLFEEELRTHASRSGVAVVVERINGQLNEDSLGKVIEHTVRSPYVITSRLDNDDVIASDFIETVQMSFRPDAPLVIDIPRGAQYHGGALYAYSLRLSAFISYVEQSQGAVSVLRDQHPSMGRHGAVEVVEVDHPIWAQVVHGGNVANQVTGWRIDPGPFRAYFPALRLPSVGPLDIYRSRLEVAATRVWSFSHRVARRAGALLGR